MAKAAKPEFLHAPKHVIVSPDQPQNSGSKQRKRIAMQTGVYKDKRAANYGEMRASKVVTDARWKKIIAAIANGKTRAEAAKIANITMQSIDAYLISNIAAYKQLRDAALVWHRRNWDTDLIEQILTDMATGMSLKASCLQHGVSDRYKSLMTLIHRDKQIRAIYDDARELWAESFLDDTIDIADDSENDRLPNGKVNNEVVNRSKLRIEARWKAMGAVSPRRFGNNKHIEHEGSITLNHIATLTGARKRLEKLRPGTDPTKVPVIIENDTGELATT